MLSSRRAQPRTPGRQRGMATLMVMILTGTALTVTTLGMMYSIRSAQEQQMASHATVAAETRAWEGVELVRQYLQSVPQASVTVGALQVTGANFAAQVVAKESAGSETLVTANITGSSNLATSTLQAVYTLGGAAATGTTLGNALTFNGDLNYSGGSLSIVNGPHLAYINLNGTLRISSGAKAYVSGCAKNGIELSGGGVADNAILRTEGTFTMSSATPPNNLTLAAKNINITQDGGSYSSVKAGAFSANVMSAGRKIGTALVGGVINTDTSITPVSEGTALITLADNTVYALDLTKVGISGSTVTTTAQGAAKRISGTSTLPDTLSMTYSAVYGGEVAFKTATVGTFWANNINFSGWSATYSLLKAHGNVSILTAAVGQYQGGGNLSVTQWNTPTFSSASRISGAVLNNSGGTPYTGNAIVNLSFAVPNSSPGLPGVPFCDLTLKPVDVSTLRDQANYVFYFDGNTPMLKIQNVKKADGSDVAPGPYNLATTDLQRIGGANFLVCNWYYNTGGNNTCGKSASPSTGWVFNGVMNFPPGVAWFQGDMTFDGVQVTRFTNSLLSTGNVTLTSSSNAPLYAPNFAGASQTCGGAFYPTNLCKSPSALMTWSDANGATRTGIPLGNIAIEAERALYTNGWTIWGNVILGGLVNASGATTNIKGGLSTGNNGVTATTISAGGIAVDVSAMTSDQSITGTTTSGSSTSGSSGASTTVVKWVRPL
ncbi:hypothetical protein RRX38_17305 [Pseudomonas sp. DTU_2021_1001937_2_SI_NGA_ILE_001]|uniref:hypothetical protein n=1 Tax=Pseudomonas sp. DTU_2021_1001937_2_SI_NGA_ILE_001 TaxID=3077589 RepID=UPI0028FC12BA|nr:hypothetical protein [Pseudomonas sp. DTU_2021_1001937_2_SI_NGA_ILE_001]WNW12834.1 hypothetical protein RRX38_17305 [Pseudomonas sp. DTU_2021_1001937_2_SI_NGA_ILE_001]